MKISSVAAVTGFALHHRQIFKSRLRPFFAFLFLVAAVPAVSGADFWEKKEYREWSERQAAQILTDSPWARIYKLTAGGGATGTDGTPQYVQYAIQLRSALPIRQATVRLSQIASNYDKLSSEQKQAFDKEAESYLSTVYVDAVIVHIEYTTNILNLDQTLAKHWQMQTTDTLKNTTYLIGTNGAKAPLLEYRPAQGAARSFQFIFPRVYEGQPILSPQDKNLTLEFEYPGLSGSGSERGLIDFKVKKMLIGDALEY